VTWAGTFTLKLHSCVTLGVTQHCVAFVSLTSWLIVRFGITAHSGTAHPGCWARALAGRLGCLMAGVAWLPGGRGSGGLLCGSGGRDSDRACDRVVSLSSILHYGAPARPRPAGDLPETREATPPHNSQGPRAAPVPPLAITDISAGPQNSSHTATGCLCAIISTASRARRAPRRAP
jgi:hypothetical protein